jgi:hypothetical protein
MNRRIHIIVIAILVCATQAVAGPYQGALIRVDRPAPDGAQRLLDMGFTVVRNAGWYLLAIADASQLETIDRLQMSYRVLDTSVEDKTYYTVTAITQDRLDDLYRVSRVLFLQDGAAVVAGPPGGGDRIAQAGFDVQRVFMRPVTPSRRPARDFVRRAPAQSNPLIEDMVAAVSGPVIDGYVQRLQDFETRWAWASNDSCQAAVDWIVSEFSSFGLLNVQYQDFSSSYFGNVVAILPGTINPEQVVIIGGHYDSTSGSAHIAAPGADDNASGTACVLQCARILSNYVFEKTVVFIAFGAEEQGLEGSEYYAAQAAAAGDDIVAMINVDMLGYLASGDDVDVDLISNTASQWLRDRAMTAAVAYVPETPVVDGYIPVGGSDHMSFWDQGYPAIMLWEDSDQHSPYIHTLADTIGQSYNHPHLAQQSTRVVVALLADLAGPVGTAIGADDVLAPSISLEQNVPNPFNPRTMIRFDVPAPGAPASLRIYDVTGREVAVLVDGETVAGTRTVWWNGTSRGGRPVASGVYFYRLTAGRETLTRKLLLVR